MSTPALSPTEFRAALGMFATGVTIITTRTPDGALAGFTASSFNSVSLTPPLVLWSLGQQAGSMASFMQTSHYAIHVLSVEQQDLALRFSSKASDRFEGVAWTEGLHGVPVIAGCAASFECASKSRYPEGDHVIFVGEVLRCARQEQASPLLYHGGKFYTEHPL